MAPGYDPIILTPTKTNADGTVSATTSSSSSSSAAASNEERIYNVITGTLENFREDKIDRKNPFENTEVLPEDIRKKIEEIQKNSDDTK